MGNGWFSYYEIYLQNDNKSYSYIGYFSSGGHNEDQISLVYIKDSKVFGKWYEARIDAIIKII